MTTSKLAVLGVLSLIGATLFAADAQAGRRKRQQDCGCAAPVATTCNTYSPGSPNVAVVVDFPLKGAVESLRSTFSISGRSLAKATLPGPRYLVHFSVTGVLMFLGFCPLFCQFFCSVCL